MVAIICPNCGSNSKVSEREFGRKWKCIFCGCSERHLARPNENANSVMRYSVTGIRAGREVTVELEGSERNVYMHAQDSGIRVRSIQSIVTGQLAKAPPHPGGKAGFSFVGLIGIAVICWWIKGTLFPSTVPNTPVSSLTFADFDSKFSTESQMTDAQKDQAIAQYKGTRVQWQGILENVDGDMADFREKATTLTHDVALEVADSEKSKLASLNKGDLVTYEGTIVDYGALIAHRLDEGRIVDSKSMSPDERAIWLANSSTAALQPITENPNTPSPPLAPNSSSEHDDETPQTIQQKAAWIRRHPGGEAFTGTDEDLARLYDKMKLAVGN